MASEGGGRQIIARRRLGAVLLAAIVLGSSLVALVALDIVPLDFSKGPTPPGGPSPLDVQMTVHDSQWVIFEYYIGLSLKVNLTLNNTGREVQFMDPARFGLELSNGARQVPDVRLSKLPELFHPLSGGRLSLVFVNLSEDVEAQALTFGYDWEGKVRAMVPSPVDMPPAKADLTYVFAYWFRARDDGRGELRVEHVLTNHDAHDLFVDNTRFFMRTGSLQSYAPIPGSEDWRSTVLSPGERLVSQELFAIPTDETPRDFGFEPFWGDNVTAGIPPVEPTASTASVTVSSVEWFDVLRLSVDVCNTGGLWNRTWVNSYDQFRLRTTEGEFFEPQRRPDTPEFLNLQNGGCLSIFLFFDAPPQATPESLFLAWRWEEPLVVKVVMP